MMKTTIAAFVVVVAAGTAFLSGAFDRSECATKMRDTSAPVAMMPCCPPLDSASGSRVAVGYADADRSALPAKAAGCCSEGELVTSTCASDCGSMMIGACDSASKVVVATDNETASCCGGVGPDFGTEKCCGGCDAKAGCETVAACDEAACETVAACDKFKCDEATSGGCDSDSDCDVSDDCGGETACSEPIAAN
ncbi:MAG: hypothetical protein JJU36_12365 [Phycisphaeraceae bacterium]|nr:hypothetical protein [Phycisphaeraceae bacterium]